MEFFILLSNGSVFSITAEGSDSIQNIKQKILDLRGIPVNQQRLFFNGSELQDNRTLADFNIRPSSTLLLLLPGEGLAPIPTLSVLGTCMCVGLIPLAAVICRRNQLAKSARQQRCQGVQRKK